MIRFLHESRHFVHSLFLSSVFMSTLLILFSWSGFRKDAFDFDNPSCFKIDHQGTFCNECEINCEKSLHDWMISMFIGWTVVLSQLLLKRNRHVFLLLLLCPGSDERFWLPPQRSVQHHATRGVCSHCRPQPVSSDSRNHLQVFQRLAKQGTKPLPVQLGLPQTNPGEFLRQAVDTRWV